MLGLPRLAALTDTRTKIPIKKISATQMEERKKKGLCYNCDDKWVLGHKCKNATLFLLEGVEMTQDSDSGEQFAEIEDGVTTARGQEEMVEVEITLYALVGSPTLGTMRVKGRIKTISLVFLVDFGSTHNFIDASVIPGLYILVDESQILKVKVANGDTIKTQGLCKDVPVYLQGHIFMVQLHVLPLGGCDLVLGTQWLSTMGVINWDFKHLSIIFTYAGKQVLLQGINTPMGLEVQDGVQFFKEPTRKGLILQITANCPTMKWSSLPTEITTLLPEFMEFLLHQWAYLQ